jgi:hypothetical protein
MAVFYRRGPDVRLYLIWAALLGYFSVSNRSFRVFPWNIRATLLSVEIGPGWSTAHEDRDPMRKLCHRGLSFPSF